MDPVPVCRPRRTGRTLSYLQSRRGRRPMTAWTPWARGRRVQRILTALLPFLAGCHGFAERHAEDKIPQYGVIDPHQPRELQMVSMPAHVVEPPDELEITVRPLVADLAH